ncbi:hypothetical protein NO042_560003 [Flavobacterium psychrophilum]|nr:hypothetical protein NO042_560003 [Flavobacterium psychrophilum]
MLSHDVLPSPALLDFLREQALSKTPQSGGSLAETIFENLVKKKNYEKINFITYNYYKFKLFKRQFRSWRWTSIFPVYTSG